MKKTITICLLFASLLIQAQNNTGQAELDKGIAAYESKNFKEAFRWFSDAAQKGNIHAKNNLGLLYLLGDGVDQSLNEGRKWLKEAADGGYGKAVPLLWEMDKAVIAFLLMSPYHLHDWEGSNDKYGFVDFEYDELIIPPKYENGGLFSDTEGLAPAQLNGKWGFIDWSDQVVIPFQFEQAAFISFWDGLAAVKQNGKWGFIDIEGKTIIPFQYDKIESNAFINGYAKVIQNGREFFIDKTGKIIKQ